MRFIQPGKPTQNAFVESFNGKFREYRLNLHGFASLMAARAIIDDHLPENFNFSLCHGRGSSRILLPPPIPSMHRSTKRPSSFLSVSFGMPEGVRSIHF